MFALRGCAILTNSLLLLTSSSWFTSWLGTAENCVGGLKMGQTHFYWISPSSSSKSCRSVQPMNSLLTVLPWWKVLMISMIKKLCLSGWMSEITLFCPMNTRWTISANSSPILPLLSKVSDIF